MKCYTEGLCKLNKHILWAQQQAYKQQVKDGMVSETWIGIFRVKVQSKVSLDWVNHEFLIQSGGKYIGLH